MTSGSYQELHAVELALARSEINNQLVDCLKNSLRYRAFGVGMSAATQDVGQEDGDGEMADPAMNWSDGPLLVRAAPGLGKTHLTLRMAEILWGLEDDELGLEICHD